MPVRGGRAVARALERAPGRVRENIEAAISKAADMILADMRRLAPRGTGRLAAALSRETVRAGLGAVIGLTDRREASRFFYARFLELGTKGGQVRYRRAGSRKVHQMNVPARPARPFMRPALDLNRDEVEALIRRAVVDALRGRRG